MIGIIVTEIGSVVAGLSGIGLGPVVGLLMVTYVALSVASDSSAVPT